MTGVSRRRFLTGLAAAGATARPFVAGAASDGARSDGARRRAVYLVPGYHPDYALFEGQPLSGHAKFLRGVSPNYEGPLTMVTRVDEAGGDVQRAVFPISGHHIAVAPDRSLAVFSSMEGKQMLTFDPDSLEIGTVAAPHRPDFMGGGHSVFLPGGRHIAVTERAHYRPFSGRAEDHHGRISIRDAVTLKVLAVYGCAGIAPHDIALTADGRHLVVANYGSTASPPTVEWAAELPYVVEPSLAMIEVGTGKTVSRFVQPDRRFEVRHLAAYAADRVFAIQTRMESTDEGRKGLAAVRRVVDVDVTVSGDMFYAPAPVLGLDTGADAAAASVVMPADGSQFRQGQTIVYDPVHDEAIATFTTSHRIAVIDGASKRIKTIIATDRLGLHNPRGLAFHPDGKRYAVSGSWRDLYLFHRGSHNLDREGCRYVTFYDHSHMSIA
ncbi:MAG: DUF1513 domain-containing protein [Rhodospirillales bacterium]|nr:DUF1513 domain-containing protein [Rhodospirillales bacterium]